MQSIVGTLTKQTVQTQDNIFLNNVGWYNHDIKYYDHSLGLPTVSPVVGDGVVFEQYFLLDDMVVEHSRIAYNLVILLGDLGGVSGVLIFLAGFLTEAISEQSFILKYIEKMYLAKTTSQNIFKEMKNKKFKTLKYGLRTLNWAPIEETNNYYPIKLSCCQEFKLFIMTRVFCFRCCFTSKKDKSLKKLFNTGL